MKTDGYVRQEDNEGAVINTDKGALEAYKKRKEREKEIDEFKKDIVEIKSLLRELLKESR